MPLSSTQEQQLAYAKAKASEVRSVYGTTTWKQEGVPMMRQCVAYTDYSGVMYDSTRMEEALWILNEVQTFAFYDLYTEPGGLEEFSAWCEANYHQMLNHNPYDAQAVNALSDIYKNRAEYYLNKIAMDGGPSPDKVNTMDYFNARSALSNSVDFQQRCVRNAIHQEAIPISMKSELMIKEVETRFSLSRISEPSEYAIQAAIIAGILQSARHHGYAMPSQYEE
ncbi:hypothetical protein BJ508DRAFT_326547 [Ascobolus immersus RN42]|uniref:Uncharacterized protein n=1 Tax=Ascobolus immersus RN42 TaxID=1160509 RepID=A0A3N4I5Q1_ASCIM|nr:hypothetical protein BJ508DRAFT_326547 [Ascobolus immersus RN42]